MKILFYDTKQIEKTYFEEEFKKTDKILAKYYDFPLLNSTNINQDDYDAEAISIFVTSYLQKEVLEKFKNLKYIFLRCVGFSNVDLKYCKDNNIKILNTPNYGNSTVAEYVFAMLLTLVKKIDKAKNDLQEGFVEYNYIEGVELCHKTFGIIGLGAIGKKIHNIAKGFNMDVLVYDIKKEDGNYNYVELDELLKNSDFISINCPLTPETKGLIGENEFNKMKPNAYLINTARGEIIQTSYLYDALLNKKIKGALLDVIECEEMLCAFFERCKIDEHIKQNCLKKFLFINKLMKMKNVIITPHNAYNTKEAKQRIMHITLDNIQSCLDINTSLKNLVLI